MAVTMNDEVAGAVEPLPSGRADRALIAALRIGVAVLWIQNTGWKRPPDFGENSGRGLYMWTKYAVDREVFAPYAWVVEHVVLPNFTFFGWMTLIVEASLGAFLLVGLATRLWAAIGVGQSLAIMLSVAPTSGLHPDRPSSTPDRAPATRTRGFVSVSPLQIPLPRRPLWSTRSPLGRGALNSGPAATAGHG